MIFGVMCWFLFYKVGVYLVLGLVLIIFFMLYVYFDLGIFVCEEMKCEDILNVFEYWWKNLVEIFFGLFGFCNVGVVFFSVGMVIWLVFVGLLLGKLIGIMLFMLFF